MGGSQSSSASSTCCCGRVRHRNGRGDCNVGRQSQNCRCCLRCCIECVGRLCCKRHLCQRCHWCWKLGTCCNHINRNNGCSPCGFWCCSSVLKRPCATTSRLVTAAINYQS